jgi:hypothetical protein
VEDPLTPVPAASGARDEAPALCSLLGGAIGERGRPGCRSSHMGLPAVAARALQGWRRPSPPRVPSHPAAVRTGEHGGARRQGPRPAASALASMDGRRDSKRRGDGVQAWTATSSRRLLAAGGHGLRRVPPPPFSFSFPSLPARSAGPTRW